MSKVPVLAGLVVALAGASPAPVVAQPIGTTFTYQGRLTDAGSPANGAYDLQLLLFDSAAAGSQVGPMVTRDDVTVSSGLFTVSLDFGPVFGGSKRWLQIGVRSGTSTGAYSILSSRQELTPSPNAVWSGSAPWTGVAGKPSGFADDVDNDALGGLSCVDGQVAKWSASAWRCAADVDSPGWGLSGNAGTSPARSFVGTTDDQPLELRVNGERALRLEPGVQSPNVIAGSSGNSVTPPARGVVIAGGGHGGAPNRAAGSFTAIGGGLDNTADFDSGTVAGGRSNWSAATYSTISGGDANRAGGGFSTIAGGSNNRTIGGFAAVGGGSNNLARGVMSTVPGGSNNEAGGESSFAAGTFATVRPSDRGTFVWADSTAAQFTSTGTDQFLVRASGGVGINKPNPSSALDVNGSIKAAAVANTNGIEGTSFVPGTTGIYGRALATAGFSIGVRGDTASPDGIAVWGYSTPSGASGFPIGVEGRSDSPQGVGVNGFAAAGTGVNIGVRGFSSSPQGWAGYFIGNVNVLGTLVKAGGAFKIDHPLDPENKSLYHSFVESPDMKNVYDGVVTTDDDGFATVRLPDWFEALNRDFRYQLTVIGGGRWARARVSQEVADNRFVVETDGPGVKVSWQVTGIRHDTFAETHRIPLEEDKPESERGLSVYAH